MLAAIRAVGTILIGIVAKLLGPFGWIASIIISPLIDWLYGAEQKRETDVANHEASEAQATHDTQKASEIKPDSTKEQVSAAIDDELSHL